MSLNKFTYLLLLLLIFSRVASSQQLYQDSHFQINTGITFNVGTAMNRIGFFVGGYYVHDNLQFNLQIRPAYNLSSWGTLKATPELIVNLGILYGYGKIDTTFNKFINEIGNQTYRKSSVAFSYNFYFDKLGSSQKTGTFAFEFNKFGIVHENDMFGERRSDKFRTAGILFYYRTQDFIFASNILLWHGDAFDDKAIQVENSDYPARFGYKDLSKVKYGKFSHGILSAQINYANNISKIQRFDIGIDSEHVRNISQNILIHDKRLVPDKYVGYKLRHYPMLDPTGMPYLYKKEQKIKPSKFYINFARNPNLFY